MENRNGHPSEPGSCEATRLAAVIAAAEGGTCPECVDDLPLIGRFFIIHNMTMRLGDRLGAAGITSSRGSCSA